MHHRQTAWLGGGLVVIALALAVFRPARNEATASSGLPSQAAAKSQDRGVFSGTVSQRFERFMLLWRGVSGGKGSKEDSKLAAELIATLPAATLRELLMNLAPAQGEGDPAWLPLIASRIGELDGKRAADWLLGLRDSMSPEESEPFLKLLPATIRGWSTGDPLGMLANYFDVAQAIRYGVSEALDARQGAGGMGATVVANAAGRSPEETWRSLRTWQRGTLAIAFFDGVDPGQARHYAARLKELFTDLDKPGFEHMGGDQEDWEEQQKALGAAAGALFLINPEEAIAWRVEHDLGQSGERSEAERGLIAGQISARLYREQPERALTWIGGQPEEFRRAAAGELGYAIIASRTLSAEDYERVATLKDWTGGEQERVAWLKGIERSFESELDRRRIANGLLENLELTAVEKDYLSARYAYW